MSLTVTASLWPLKVCSNCSSPASQTRMSLSIPPVAWNSMKPCRSTIIIYAITFIRKVTFHTYHWLCLWIWNSSAMSFSILVRVQQIQKQMVCACLCVCAHVCTHFGRPCKNMVSTELTTTKKLSKTFNISFSYFYFTKVLVKKSIFRIDFEGGFTSPQESKSLEF